MSSNNMSNGVSNGVSNDVSNGDTNNETKMFFEMFHQNREKLELISKIQKSKNVSENMFLFKNELSLYFTALKAETIFWEIVSTNATPDAIHLLEANPDKISWRHLSSNPSAMHILEANLNKINWCFLSCNPEAIHLLKHHPEKINWCFLSSNPNAKELLKNNINKINYEFLTYNPNTFIRTELADKIEIKDTTNHINIILKNIERQPNTIRNRTNWSYLSLFPKAIPFLETNQDKIDWVYFYKVKGYLS